VRRPFLCFPITATAARCAIAMASEYRSEFLGISLIRSESFQIFTGTAAAVIQQDGGELAAALRAPIASRAG
jgi:hypothetical protein